MDDGGVKKLCIFLTNVSHFYYLLLGASIGVAVYSQVKNVRSMLPFLDTNPFILIFSVTGFMLLRAVAFSEFYTPDERKTRELSGEIDRFRIPRWDRYFATKINTELPVAKRLFGYIYAILRLLELILLAYSGVMIACLFYK